MILYISVAMKANYEEVKAAGISDMLVSYFYDKKTPLDSYPCDNLFCDSGAYTAFTKGVKINPDEYMGYLSKWKKEITEYCCLDVIGDQKSTFKNYSIMVNNGFKPYIVFHYGTDYEILRKYLDAGMTKIAIGGLVPLSFSFRKKMDFLRQVFFILKDRNDPYLKIHGFGMTSIREMLYYDWTSVDSTVWVLAAGMGQIIFPTGKRFVRINLSAKNDHRILKGKLGSACKDFVESIGCDYELCKSSYMERRQVNLKVLKMFCDSRSTLRGSSSNKKRGFDL